MEGPRGFEGWRVSPPRRRSRGASAAKPTARDVRAFGGLEAAAPNDTLFAGLRGRRSRGRERLWPFLAAACSLLLCLLATPAAAQSPADRVACDESGCISETRFAAALCGGLEGAVAGYACLVGDRPPISGGVARTDEDPPRLAFSAAARINVASLTKIATTVLILRLLEENGLTEEAKIAPLLYPDWPRGPNVERLTFRDLLTHRSGLNDCEESETYGQMRAIIAQGARAEAIGKPAYGNCNFALLRELTPALMHRSLTLTSDGPRRAIASAALFLAALNAKALAPAGIGPRDCRPARGALSYPAPPGEAHGEAWGDWTLKCGATGLQVSAEDLHALLLALISGEALLKRDTVRRVFAECLGSDCAVGADCGSARFCKQGKLTAPNGAALWAYAGIVKCDVPVVLLVNSELPAQYQRNGNVFALVRDALTTAAVKGETAPCP